MPLATAFVVTEYDDEEDAVLPISCPRARDGKTCRLGQHAWRRRSTGPCHHLLVMRCYVHAGFFTLYPPGFAPYLRRPLTEPESQQEERTARKRDERWRQPLRRDLAPPARRPVGRVVHFFARMLGISQDDRTLERAARALEVPALVLREAARGFAASRCPRRRAAAVRQILAEMAKSARSLFERLIASGTLVGVWPGPAARCTSAGQLRVLAAVPIDRNPA